MKTTTTHLQRIGVAFLALILSVNIFFAQSDGIYFYQNDGSYNAFLKNEVDSIVLSHYDLDSIYYADYVSQVVFTKTDTVFIPIAVIDSVSFETPEIKLKKNVIDIKSWINSIESTDTASLSINVTNELRDKATVGDVLLYADYDDLFPDGFAGKVIKIEEEGKTTKYLCEEVSLEEIYDEIFIVGCATPSTDNVPKQNALGDTNIETGYENKVTATLSCEEDGAKLSASLSYGYSVRCVIKKSPSEPLYLKIKLSNELGADLGLSLESNCSLKIPKNIGKYLSPAFVNLPIPNTLGMVRLKVRAAPFLKLEGSAMADLALHATGNFTTEIEYKDGEVFSTCSSGANAKFDTLLSFGGSLSFGVRLYPYISGLADMFTVGITADIGPKFSGEFLYDISKNVLFDPKSGTGIAEAYEELKDNNIIFEAGTDLDLNVKLLKQQITGEQFGMNYSKFWKIYELYLFPEFSDLESEKVGENTHSVKTIVSRDTWCSHQIGFGVHTDGELYDVKYDSNQYQFNGVNGSELKQEISPLYAGTSYTIYPYIKFLGQDIMACPSLDIYDRGEVITDAAKDITWNAATLCGELKGFEDSQINKVFLYSNPNEILDIRNSNTIIAEGDNKVSARLNGIAKGSYQYALCAISPTDSIVGNIMSFTTAVPPVPHPHTDSCFVTSRRTALLYCTYDDILDGADCGYALYNDRTKEYQKFFFGQIEGSHVFNLTDLDPDTSYYVYSIVKESYTTGDEVIHYGEKKYLGTTLPSPGSIKEIYGETDHEAFIICYRNKIRDRSYKLEYNFGIEIESEIGSKSYFNGNIIEEDEEWDILEFYVSDLTPFTKYRASVVAEYEDDRTFGGVQDFCTGVSLNGTWELTYTIPNFIYNPQTETYEAVSGSAIFSAEDAYIWPEGLYYQGGALNVEDQNGYFKFNQPVMVIEQIYSYPSQEKPEARITFWDPEEPYRGDKHMGFVGFFNEVLDRIDGYLYYTGSWYLIMTVNTCEATWSLKKL